MPFDSASITTLADFEAARAAIATKAVAKREAGRKFAATAAALAPGDASVAAVSARLQARLADATASREEDMLAIMDEFGAGFRAGPGALPGA